MRQLWKIAFRDLGRNRRRSALTLLAVALGIGLLIVMTNFVEGEVGGALDNAILLQTGHLQVRAATYEEDKLSLTWEDLLDQPEALAGDIVNLEHVQTATPILWANGILNTAEDSVGARVVGIEPDSQAHNPFRESVVAGQFIDAADRSGLLLGHSLAEDLNVSVGSQVNLLVSTSDGNPDEAIFTVRGIFATGVPMYDETTIFLPLSKAQAFTRTEGKASAIFVLLDAKENAGGAKAALQSPQLAVLDWQDMHSVLLQAAEMSAAYMGLMNLIVLAVVAVVIANTLLMAVFERTREMGILAALGMKGRQILAMFLLEALILAIAGTFIGLLIGGAGTAYFAHVGVHVGDVGATGFALGETVYARFSPSGTISVCLMGLVITMLAALYPAWFASRLEPIDALRAL